MNQKAKKLFIFTIFIFVSLIFEIIYIKLTEDLTIKEIRDKKEFVSLSGITDLAISTEANYIRNRTLTDLFSIYRDDPSLMEYFPSTFVYSHSHISNKDNIIEK